MLTDRDRQEREAQTVAFWEFHEKQAEKKFTTDIENMSLAEYGKNRGRLGIKNEVSYEW